MRRIKPVVAVAALAVWVAGERWLRSKMRTPCLALTLAAKFPRNLFSAYR